MYIKDISIRNFRILFESQMDFSNNICLMLGRNNTGKTSFLVLFEKFLGQSSFDYNDFSVKQREKILKMDTDTDETELAIQLVLHIQYEDNDDLCNISEFIVDLDSSRKDVHLLFECEIKKDNLLDDFKHAGKISKEKFIKKYLVNYLEKCVYTFNDISDIKRENRHRLIKKSFKEVNKLIDFEIIHVIIAEENTMATAKEFMDNLLNGLECYEVTCRAMMGEYVVYCKGKVVGGAYDGRLLVKPTASALELLPNAEYMLPYEGAKPALYVEDINDKTRLGELLSAIADDLPTPKKKKK